MRHWDRERMTQAEILEEEAVREYVRRRYWELVKSIDQYDPNANNFEIIDTDYDNYLVLTACMEFQENMNGEGQTESEVEKMKEID